MSCPKIKIVIINCPGGIKGEKRIVIDYIDIVPLRGMWLGVRYVKCNVINEREDSRLQYPQVSTEFNGRKLQGDVHGIMKYTAMLQMHA